MEEDDLIKKWLVGKLTDTEKESFDGLEDVELNKKIVEKAILFDVPIDTTVKSYDEFKADLKVDNVPVIKLKPYTMLFRIASIFIIGMGLYFFFFFNNLTTVQTLASQRQSFELPDASIIVLNAASTVEYDKKNWDIKRKVSLDGEAFFKVEKGSKFDVTTSSGTVSVLGTQFNVKNRVGHFEVTCFEGTVGVTVDGKMKKLNKGAIFRIINNIIILDSISINQPKWIDNISNFKGIPLSIAINELERQYGVEIETVDIDIERLFTGSFTNNNLDQALKSITVPFNLTYKKSNSNKIGFYKSEQ